MIDDDFVCIVYKTFAIDILSLDRIVDVYEVVVNGCSDRVDRW